MKRRAARCLSLYLALFLILPAASAEEVVTLTAGWDQIDYQVEEDSGRLIRISDDLPLQVWIPGSMTEAEAGGDDQPEGLISCWYHPDTRMEVSFIYCPQAPVPYGAETVREFRDMGEDHYAQLYEINGIPAVELTLEEMTDDFETFFTDNMYYYLDGGSCMILRAFYPGETMFDVEYYLAMLDYSVSRIE